MSPAVKSLPFTGNDEADRLLAASPLALLIGMLLDQQVPLEWAFSAPHTLRERLGGKLDAADIAAMNSEELAGVFSQKPALHRYPGAMAARTHELCRHVVANYGGEADRIWNSVKSGDELYANVRALPGFGEQKAQIFVALLAKRLGVTPPGWEEAAGAYGKQGWFSVADIDGPEALARVREHKKAVKAEAKARKG
jgi:uncharacterized HhH-GPD family protein